MGEAGCVFARGRRHAGPARPLCCSHHHLRTASCPTLVAAAARASAAGRCHPGPGRRTVASVLRITGHSRDRHFTNYHRALSRAPWNIRDSARSLVGHLVRAFAPRGPIIVGLDDTIEQRWGSRIAARTTRSCRPSPTPSRPSAVPSGANSISERQRGAKSRSDWQRPGPTPAATQPEKAEVELRAAAKMWPSCTLIWSPEMVSGPLGGCTKPTMWERSPWDIREAA